MTGIKLDDPASRNPRLWSAFLSSPHRPMFIAAGLWAIVVIALTTWETGFGPARAPLQSTASWHGHEMIFGFAAAGFAGYTLTAMTSWSGQAGLSRLSVLVLLALWIVARLAAWGALGNDQRLVVPAGIAFLVCVSAILVRAALRSGASRGAVQALIATLLAGLQAAVLSGAVLPQPPVLALALLLSAVGGRIIAAFTWNQIDGRRAQDLRFKAAGWIGLPSATTIGVALALDTMNRGQDWLVPGLLLFAAAAEAARLLLWQSRQIWNDALLGMLHLGYFWLPLGLALVALARLPGGSLAETEALHALTAGAVACSIYSMAARAVARRADRLRPATIDKVGFILLWLAAALRVFAPADTVLSAAAILMWGACWALFLMRHFAALFHPSPRPVFSGLRADRRAASDSAPL